MHVAQKSPTDSKSETAKFSLWLGVVIAAVYLYCFPYFPGIRSANELPRVYLTVAMAEHGTFHIDAEAALYGSTADVSPARGHIYSNKAPGTSILAMPAYWALKVLSAGESPSLAAMFWAFRVTTGIVPTLLFLPLLWRFLRRVAPDLATRRWAIVIYALGSMALTYSVLFIAHQISAICIAAGFFVALEVIEQDRRDWQMLWSGFLAGCAPLMDYQAAFAGVPIAAFLVWKIVQNKRYALVGFAAAGAIVPIAILLFYHTVAFGGPLHTGYDASQTFAHYHQRGFLGLDQFRWEAFIGSTVAADNGFFFLAPIWLFIFPGLFLMWRKNPIVGCTSGREMSVVIGSIVAIYLAFISCIVFWRGGWQVGPRYITAMLPFALLPVAMCIHLWRNTWLRVALVATTVVSVFIYCGSAALFPHFPEKFKNPLRELLWPLLHDGLVAPNAANAMGIPGAWSLLPFALLLLGVLVWTFGRDKSQLRQNLLGGLLAVCVFVAYWQFPGGGEIADKALIWVKSVVAEGMPR